MLHAGKRRRGVTLDQWLRRGPSYRAMLLTNTTEARVPRPLESRPVAAAGTKLQGNAPDKHDGSQSTKTAGVKAERNRQYENNESFV